MIMTYKHLFGIMFAASLALTACNSGDNAKKDDAATTETTDNATAADEGTNPKGIGPHQNIELTNPLDEKMIAEGKNIYEVKCASCHKLSDERLVGPGWHKVTERRTPEWIMNFITNTDEMIEKDTAAQNMLEVCLVKMPNQGLSEADARATLEFMRQVDSK
jgi:cytochrome c2